MAATASALRPAARQDRCPSRSDDALHRRPRSGKWALAAALVEPSSGDGSHHSGDYGSGGAGVPAGRVRETAGAAAVQELCGAGETGSEPGRARGFLPDHAGRGEGADSALRTDRGERRGRGSRGSANRAGAEPVGAVEGEGESAGSERRQRVPPGLGASVVPNLRAPRRGLRNGALWENAGETTGQSNAGPLHQYVTDSDSGWRGECGVERAASARVTGRVDTA